MRRPPPASPASTLLRRGRVSVTAAYAVQGMAFAVMLTNVPTYKDRLGMDDAIITLAVLWVCVCAGTGSALSGLLAARYGSAKVVTGGLIGAALAVLAVGFATTWPAFLVAFGAYGLCLGSVDASINMQGIMVERGYGRSVLASFFAANAAGGVLGALSVSAAALADAELDQSLPLVAVVVVAATLVLSRGLLHGAETPAPTVPAPTMPDDVAHALPSASPSAVPLSTIVVLGAAMLAYPVADSSASTWGAPFLRDILDAGKVVAPLGYAAYQATLIASRLFADSWVARAGRVTVVRLGGTVGAAGLLTVALAPGWPVALVGFAATGLGLGVVAPLAFSAAGDRAAEAAARAGQATTVVGTSAVSTAETSVETVTDQAVARLNIFTYVGAVLGGALTGVFATADALRAGFVVLAGLALVSAVLARRFRETALPETAPPETALPVRPAPDGTSRP
ncbi:Sugar phosphate permease [Sanguibacter gelidistatuariae]|uniref:Sugar phosphate permease n=1 Tax=Sanguibacter gelidistatuariae TaxID=1814289 RepID=A0A1G6KY91_9MICO|nr:Sugar phosphate permease [Sanguibacter gelidistatuariae]